VHNAPCEDVNVKGFFDLQGHFAKHGNVADGVGNRLFGRAITQNEYASAAKNFAQEQFMPGRFQEADIGGRYIVRYDPITERLVVINAKNRTISTFHTNDTNDRNDANVFMSHVQSSEMKVLINTGVSPVTSYR
jgi:hypothetical protein